VPDILVTGAAGFLGRGIVAQAAAVGLTVRATDRSPLPFAAPVECVQADILDPVGIREAFGGAAAVIHSAGLAHCFDRRASTASQLYRVNEEGTANVARAAAEAGARHLIVVSSVSVYGVSRRDQTDESAECYPEGPYAKSKWRAEQRAREITASAGIRLTILRLATLYGEEDPGNVARLMRTIDRGYFLWIGDGSNRKSVLHRDDAARACLLAAGTPGQQTEIYNVSAPPCAMRTIVNDLAAELGRRLPSWHVPVPLALRLAGVLACLSVAAGISASLKKWLSDDKYSCARFTEAAGFCVRVGLEEGLKREVAWYRSVTRSV